MPPLAVRSICNNWQCDAHVAVGGGKDSMVDPLVKRSGRRRVLGVREKLTSYQVPSDPIRY